MRSIKIFSNFSLHRLLTRNLFSVNTKSKKTRNDKHEKKDKYEETYTGKKENQIEIEQNDDGNVNEGFFDLFHSEEEVNEESIISKIKQQMEISSSFTPMEMAKINQRSSIDANFETFLSKNGDEESFYDKSKRITEAFRLKKDLSVLPKTKAMDKYGNYQDFTDVNFERKEKSFSVYKENDMVEKRGYSQDFKTGSLMRNVEDYKINKEDLDNMDIQYYIQDACYLSYKARRELYQLHLEGWSVRRLTVRYGIIPERVKAIIFCEKSKLSFSYFLTEISPFLKPEDVYRINRDLDRLDSKNILAVDYGVDLSELAERERYVPNLNFDIKDVERHRDVINFQEERRIRAQTKSRRHDWVPVDIIGEGSRAIVIKDWVVYRGMGRETVTRTFKSVLHYSHKPHLLKDKVRRKLSQGPRIAAQGFRN